MNERFADSNRDWFDEHLEAWLDGDLSETDAARMKHLTTAEPGFARELKLARHIHETLCTTPDYPCPPVVAQQVFRRARTRKQNAAGRWFSGLLSPAPARALAGLAAAVLLAVGLWVIVPQFAATPEQPLLVLNGQTFTAEEVAEAQTQLELAMAYVDQLSNEINRQVGHYVAGDGMLTPVNKGLNQGATDARESLKKLYRESSS